MLPGNPLTITGPNQNHSDKYNSMSYGRAAAAKIFLQVVPWPMNVLHKQTDPKLAISQVKYKHTM